MNVIVVTPVAVVPNTGGVSQFLLRTLPGLVSVGYTACVLFLTGAQSQGEMQGVSQVQFPSANVDSQENVKFLREKISESEQNTVVWVNSHISEQFECCCKAVKGTRAKLVYTYHQDPFAPTWAWRDDMAKMYAQYIITKKMRPLLSCVKIALKYLVHKKQIDQDIKSSISRICSNSHKVTVLSDAHKKNFTAALQLVASDNIVVIPNAFPFTPGEVKDKEKIILVVARLTWQKRIDRVFYAWKKLHRQYQDWKLVVVGDGNHARTYQTLAEALHLNRVVFVGEAPASAYQKKASILCLPSSYEGQSLVVLEALATNCVPVCLPNVACHYDGIEGVESLCDSSVKSLINKLRELMAVCNLVEKKEIRPAMSKYNCYTKYNVGAIVSQYAKVFKSLFDETR